MTVRFVSYFDYVHHEPVLPPSEGGRETRRHPVAIVGGGPIGFALALGLARHGVRSVVIEADDSVCTGSRAGCVTRRSIEIFEQLGMAAPVMRQGLPWSEGWSYYRTRPVFHLSMPEDPHARYPALVNIQQCYVEQYMVDAMAAHGDLIEVRWQNRVAAVEEHDDGVELEIETPRGGYRLAADRVVACDGAQSTVRKALGLRFVGTRYEARYVIVDIKLASALPPGRRAWFDPPSNPGATLLLHKHRDDLWRFDYQLRPEESADDAVRPENVLARVASHLELMGERGAWDPVWISLYRASALTLERYRHRRVLFAGDAAHLTPIFGVRGMNSGIDDTHNLAWKLALVARGLASERLLDSYSDERVFATRENLRHSSKSAEFMDPPSPAFAVMRSAVLELALRHEWVRSLINPRQSTAIGFPASPLNDPGDEASFAAGAAPGANVPDGELETAGGGGTHLSSLLGPRFTLLAFGDGAVAGDAAAALAARGVPARAIRIAAKAGEAALGDAAGAVAERLDAAPGTVYAVRPDGHVLGRWRQPEAATLDRAVERCLQGGAR
jgi:3-(3-hydroxy-phenyl)propionate hydroxylase